MSVMRFPHLPESSHPQYLWNEQEYIIRMLGQNAIGAGISETATHVTITTHPDHSMNFIANGPADFPNYILTETYPTNATRWVYISEDGSRFFLSDKRPDYCQYIHGHYNSNGDRAVLFIDAELPPGQRAIIMDSFNSMFEYDQRIAMTGGELVWEATAQEREITRTLPKGRYRFHLQGGTGGRGGHTQGGSRGGQGGVAPLIIETLPLLEETEFYCFLGNDGENGEDARPWVSSDEFRFSGGGGCSGESTFIAHGSWEGRRIFESIGGCGGGGGVSTFFTPGGEDWDPVGSVGAGGGGAGSGGGSDANNGSGLFGNIRIVAEGGSCENGGQGSPAINHAGQLVWPNDPRQGHLAGLRGQDYLNTNGQPRRVRAGGNSGEYHGSAKGGSMALTTSSGLLQIWRV